MSLYIYKQSQLYYIVKNENHIPTYTVLYIMSKNEAVEPLND